MLEVALLQVDGLSKAFGGLKAVDNASLRVGAGEIVALIGPNGAGKTTLFAAIAGFHKADAGRIAFEGKDITALAPHKICAAGMVRTFQITQPFAKISVRENIMVGAYLASPDRAKAEKKAEAVAAQVGMTAQLDQLGADLTVPAASASNWRARWPPAPGCCCSTRSWPVSTRPRSSISSVC